jgi:hypothetical protein
MSDKTVITFDRPDEREITIGRLLPMLRRDDSVEIDEESHVVRSATLVIDSKTGDVTLYVRLRP